MTRTDTDSQLSIEAHEFLWTEQGLGPAHRYLLPAVVKALQLSGARTVLDLGCGNGAVTSALARMGFEMTGMDNSETGLAIAREKYPGISFVHANIDTLLNDNLNQKFDAVIAIEVIEHLLLPRSLFQRAREALKPNGTLIVTTPYHGYVKNLALAMTNKFDSHWHPLRDYGHVKFFSPATLTQLFSEQSFSIENVGRLGRIPLLAKSMIVQGQAASPVGI